MYRVWDPDADRPQWLRWIGCNIVNLHRWVYSHPCNQYSPDFRITRDVYHRRECMDCDRRDERGHGVGGGMLMGPFERTVQDGNL